MTQYRAPLKWRITDYVKRHEVSLGLFLASYGVFYLAVVIAQIVGLKLAQAQVDRS